MHLRDIIANKIRTMSEDLLNGQSIRVYWQSIADDNERQSFRATLIKAFNFAFEVYQVKIFKLLFVDYFSFIVNYVNLYRNDCYDESWQ
jgi:hypothetical protein